MSLFRRKKSINFTEASPSYKVKYLGNVATSLAQGEGYIEKPITILWSNYMKTNGSQSVAMRLTVDNAGLKVSTTTQGVTQYWCHRISRYAVPEGNPRLFVWIYRHVGKKMKAELRCHAVFFSNEKKAGEVCRLLQEKKTASLHEYLREKSRRHKKKLVLDKAQAMADSVKEPTRKTLLNPGRNYKPPLEYSLKPPTLDSITEDGEEMDTDAEELSELEDLDEEEEEEMLTFSPQVVGSSASFLEYRSNGGTHSDSDESLDRFQINDSDVTHSDRLYEKLGLVRDGPEDDVTPDRLPIDSEQDLQIICQGDINCNDEKVGNCNGNGVVSKTPPKYSLEKSMIPHRGTKAINGDLPPPYSLTNPHNKQTNGARSLPNGAGYLPRLYATLPDGYTRNGHSKNGYLRENGYLRGSFTSNGLSNGHAANGHTANGHVRNGFSSNGDLSKSDVSNGELASLHLKSEELLSGSDSSYVKHSNSLLSRKGLYNLWPSSKKKANPVESTKAFTTSSM